MPSTERERAYVTDVLSRLAGELQSMSKPGARMPNGRPMGVGEWRAWAKGWVLPLHTVQGLLAASVSPEPGEGGDERASLMAEGFRESAAQDRAIAEGDWNHSADLPFPAATPVPGGDERPIDALLTAARRVRDKLGGPWIKGAPTHLLADLMSELEGAGWRLVRDPVPGGGDGLADLLTSDDWIQIVGVLRRYGTNRTVELADRIVDKAPDDLAALIAARLSSTPRTHAARATCDVCGLTAGADELNRQCLGRTGDVRCTGVMRAASTPKGDGS
jgi:hypothetical protein